MLGSPTQPSAEESFWQLARLVGAFQLLRLAWFIVKAIVGSLRVLLAKSAFQRYGPGYAVITGAAGGLGLEWARALAAQGFDLVLVDIDAVGLKRVQDAVRAAHDRCVRLVEFDLSRSDDAEAMDKLAASITEGIEVCMLVNNVGIMSASPIFTDTALWRNIRSCKVNMLPTLVLTQLLYTKVFSKRGRRSAIINVSSMNGITPWPGNAVYSATKAFAHNLSVSISKELQGCVDVLSLTPLGIATPMVGYEADGISLLAPEQVVSAALPCLGVRRSTVGHWVHALQSWLLTLAGEELRLGICQFSMILMPPGGGASGGRLPPLGSVPGRLATWLWS